MSLTVHLKNMGVLKQATFSLADLTLLCGENNTGKTYAAYTLYGFLQSWRQFIHIPIDDLVSDLLAKGGTTIDLAGYVEQADHLLAAACQEYTERLDGTFAAPEQTFQQSEFRVEVDPIPVQDHPFQREVRINEEPYLTGSKEAGSGELLLTLAADVADKGEVLPVFAKNGVTSIIGDAVFSRSLPRPFILSAERTGAAIFQRELNFSRNRLLEEMVKMEGKGDPRDLLFTSYQSYPSPIAANVDFTRQLEDVVKKESFLAKEHPGILDHFADIAGGEYTLNQNGQPYYTPKGTKLSLSMDRSASGVRSLMALNFYLRYVARQGDLLMIDEPELNLHPQNQRRIARLFATLVNLGIKVFITTHSDYIVKELNTLIMLNQPDRPHLKKVMAENGYQESELLRADQITAYIAEEALLPLATGQKRRKRGYTLVPADIDPKFGIGVSSFDTTIDAMNNIQSDIVWGEG